jgi:hypothetical protein
MRIISIITFIIFTLGAEIIADEFTYFYPESYTETDDGKNLIVVGDADMSNHHGKTVLVFNTNDFSYHSFGIVELSKRIRRRESVIHSGANLFGHYTDNHFIVYNYKTGDSIQSFEIDSKIFSAEFSSDGKWMYYSDFDNNEFEIFSLETGQLIENREIELVNDGYQLSGVNSYYDQIALRKGDSLAFYSIKGDSIVLKEKHIDYRSVNFLNKGTLFSTRVNDTIFISYTDDLSLYKRIEIDYDYDDATLSSDLKHLYLFSYYKDVDMVIDIESDSVLFNSEGLFQNDYYPFYISNDKKRSLGYIDNHYGCGRYLEMPYIARTLHVFDWENHRRLEPIPNTFIYYPEDGIFSNNGNFIAVTETINDSTYTAILNDKGEFLKYLYPKEKPKLFIEKSSQIAYEEEGKLNFYNIDTEELERALDINLSGGAEYHYSNTNRLIVAFNSDSVKIYDYDNWTLYSEYSFAEVGLDSNAKWDGDFGLTSLADSIIKKFDINQKTIYLQNLVEIPEGFQAIDFSPNGRYVLFRKEKYLFGIYDLLLNKFKTHDIEEKYGDRYNTRDVNLLGNLPIYHHAMADEFNYSELVKYVYDFDYDEYLIFENSYAFRQIAFSSDYSKMLGTNCPTGVFATELRDPVSSVNSEQIPENAIYPNPTSSFIHLDKFGVHSFSDLRIYNSFGQLVMNVGNIISTEKVDVDDLPTGVYFLQSNEIQANFVKE